MFLRPKCHKESKNGFKTISFRPYPTVFFSKNCFRYKKLSKKLDVLLIFEFLWQYIWTNYTSFKKFKQNSEIFDFFDDFWCRKQFFEKIITGQGRQLIVLNPFLDSLGNFALKNIGLPPGTGSGCFQSSQDAVRVLCFLKMCPIFVGSVHNFDGTEDRATVFLK